MKAAILWMGAAAAGPIVLMFHLFPAKADRKYVSHWGAIDARFVAGEDFEKSWYGGFDPGNSLYATTFHLMCMLHRGSKTHPETGDMNNESLGDVFEALLALAFLGFPPFIASRDAIEAAVKCVHALGYEGNHARYKLLV